MPARTVIAVADLPMGAAVQVEAVVSHGDGTPPQAIEDRHGLIIEANNTEHAPKCPFSTQTVAFLITTIYHRNLQLSLKKQSLLIWTNLFRFNSFFFALFHLHNHHK